MAGRTIWGGSAPTFCQVHRSLDVKSIIGGHASPSAVGSLRGEAWAPDLCGGFSRQLPSGEILAILNCPRQLLSLCYHLSRLPKAGQLQPRIGGKPMAFGGTFHLSKGAQVSSLSPSFSSILSFSSYFTFSPRLPSLPFLFSPSLPDFFPPIAIFILYYSE